MFRQDVAEETHEEEAEATEGPKDVAGEKKTSLVFLSEKSGMVTWKWWSCPLNG